MSTRIREFRKLRGMTLHYLAQKVGTTAQTIQRLETGNMTVSLDWLERIADVFGMPAAALLVSDATASVPVIGDLDAHGDVLLVEPGVPQKRLSMVVAAPNPIAVRVTAAVGPFDAGTVLICNKFEYDRDILLESRDCLIGTRSGVLYRRLTNSAGAGVIVDAGSGAGVPGADITDIEWVAPITMAVRYFD